MKTQNIEAPIEALEKAILDLHGCKAVWEKSVRIKETFKDQTVWEGFVQVFELIDHPSVKKCYAWSYQIDPIADKRKFIAVLHQSPVQSPQDAVRAFIASEYKS